MAGDNSLSSESLVPPTPLGGESDAGEVPGLGTAAQDDTIPTPMPDFSEEHDALKSATDSDGIRGFAYAGDSKQSSGVGNVEDRGTVAGYGTADAGGTGMGSLGMENTAPHDQRSTEPLSEQGEVTGTADT